MTAAPAAAQSEFAASAQRVLLAARGHPAAVAAAVSGAAVGAMYWHSTSRAQAALDHAQRQMAEDRARCLATCGGLLRDLDAARTADLRAKTGVLQQVHLQAVEQARSIDRLVNALKVCRVAVPHGLSLGAVAAGPHVAALAQRPVDDEVLPPVLDHRSEPPSPAGGTAPSDAADSDATPALPAA